MAARLELKTCPGKGAEAATNGLGGQGTSVVEICVVVDVVYRSFNQYVIGILV